MSRYDFPDNDPAVTEDVNLIEEDHRKVADKIARVKAYRKEASRLAAMANKRLDRLEANGFEDSDVYRRVIETGGRFSVKGKTYREVQTEVSRLKRFLDAKTSTVKGAKRVLKDMAKAAGINYNTTEELRNMAPKFFELQSKIEQYLKAMYDAASAFGYQEIWEAINVEVKEGRLNLNGTEEDIDQYIAKISNALMEFEEPVYVPTGMYKIKRAKLDDVD